MIESQPLAMRAVSVADLFCGAGGSSTGLARACADLGVPYNLTAVNHWDVAIASHMANHPSANHLLAEVDKLRSGALSKHGRLDILWASPSCFVAGTLILTARGLVPIEEIVVADSVLTHLGRWRSVTTTMQSASATVRISGQSASNGIITTPGHPFLSRSREKKSDGVDKRNWVMELGDDEAWTPAADLAGRSWATAKTVAPLPVPAVGDGRPMDTNFWWMVGRWLGDGGVRLKEPVSRNVRAVKRDRPLGTPRHQYNGVTRPNKRHPRLVSVYRSSKCSTTFPFSIGRRRRGEIRIVCGKHESESLETALAGTLHWTHNKERTVTRFTDADADITHWLSAHFGSQPERQTIPTWVLGMNAEDRCALLDGYVSADGCDDHRISRCCTISRKLALGIRLLVESLGMRATLHEYAPRVGHQIEDGPITCLPRYEVHWVREAQRLQTSIRELHSWSRVRFVDPTRKVETVYNFSVDEDESYIADGIAVHNCTEHSYAKGGGSVDDQGRVSAWAIVREVERYSPSIVIVENVPPFRNWGPVETLPDGRIRPIKKRRGETFRAWFAAIESMGYVGRWALINSADHGEPQTRVRWYGIFCVPAIDMSFPAPTHGRPGTLEVQSGLRKPWVGSREIIDWDIAGTSIFDRPRPLAPNTMRRIEEGIRRYCSGPLAEAFLVVLRNHASTCHLDEPLPAISTGSGHGGSHFAVVEPSLRPFVGANRTHNLPIDVDMPTPAVTTATGGGMFLAEPFVLGQHEGSVARTVDLPLPTVTGGGYTRVFEPFVADVRHGDEHRIAPITDPLATITAKNGLGIVESFIVPQQNGTDPTSTAEPLGTVTTTSRGVRLIEPFIASYYGAKDGEPRTRSVEDPLPTVPTENRFGLVEPIVTRSRGRVVEIDGQAYVLDVRFRMLQPHELSRAQGFPSGYRFTGTKSDQTAQIGNAVPVRVAQALLSQALLALGYGAEAAA